MKLANHHGRPVIVLGSSAGVDVAKASNHRWGPDLASVYADWAAFCHWADQAGPLTADVQIQPEALQPVSPQPSQIMAVGLNYADHVSESGFETPDRLPPVFTKFRSSLTGPDTTVELPTGGNTDWEVELVVVIGRETSNVVADEAWDYVAGVTIGQDLSERIAQLAGPAPQFSLGKSFRGFSPIGPWLVTPDELPDRDDLRLGCSVNGETVQDSRTSLLLFGVAALVAGLSQVVTLQPGDLIFTGTPSGVGAGRDPQRFLRPGDVLESWIDGIGSLRQTFVARDGD
jgi:2-keto-4-pentenoate hydratase/2-oxohepta-3-ene-1,7-dioic acid hydratase in catechol pathway